MPRSVRKKRKGEKGKEWKVIEPSGRVVGESRSKKDALASARAANASKKR